MYSRFSIQVLFSQSVIQTNTCTGVTGPGPSGFPSLSEIKDLTYTLDPTEQEGFVVVGTVVNERFPRKMHRIKVKSPQHRALEQLCWRSNDEDRTHNLLFEFIKTNYSTTFLQRFPQWKGLYNDVKREYEALRTYINDKYNAAVEKTEEGLNRDQFVKLLEKEKAVKGVLCKMMNAQQTDSRDMLRVWPQHLVLKMMKELNIQRGGEK